MKSLIVLFAAVGTLHAQLPSCTSTLEMSSKAAKAGSMVKGTVTVMVPESNHAYAPPAKSDEITIAVTPLAGSKFKLMKVAYPKGQAKNYPGFGEEPILAYEGKVQIPVQIQLPKDAKGKFAVKLNVRSQVCSNTEGQCYPPKNETVTATVTIKPGTAKK